MEAKDFQARITEQTLSTLKDIRDHNLRMADYVLKSGVSHPSLYKCAIEGWERTIDTLDKLEFGNDPKSIENGQWSKWGHRSRVTKVVEYF